MFSFLKREKVAPDKDTEIIIEDYNEILPVAEYFKKETGITFDKQMTILKNKTATFCRQKGVYSFIELVNTLKSDTSMKQELIDYLTINETFFYREFKQIQELVLKIKESGTNATILCAPCATGEEPYSIAIALIEAGVSENSFHITGIDINSDAVNKAKKAIYKERNTRNLSEQILNIYFTKKDNFYILNDKIKSNITFKVVNLFDLSFRNIGKFDYILSRNMLIYFDTETKYKAKSILEGLLKNPNQEIYFGHADLL